MAHILLVGRLPLDISEDELMTVFGTYGQVYDVQLLESGRAMVRYVKRDAAEGAMSLLHKEYKIRSDESPITVRWKEDSRPGEDGSSSRKNNDQDDGNDRSSRYKLFVGGLPNDVEEEELKLVFSTYGSVSKIHIMKPMASSGHRSAFIYFGTVAAAEDAIEVLDKQYKIRGDSTDPIIVRWGLEKDATDPSRPSDTGYKLFVGNLPEDITEEEIKIVFSTYGRVNLIHILGFNRDSGTRAALVFYSKREWGEDAIAVLHDQYKIRDDAEHTIRVKWGKEEEAKEKAKEKDDRHGSRGDGKIKKEWQGQDRYANKWDDAGWSSGAQEWKDDGWNWTGGDGRGARGWDDDKGSYWKKHGWNDGKGMGWNDDRGTGRGWDDGKGKANSDKGKSKGKSRYDDNEGKGKSDKGKSKGKSRYDDNETPNGTLYVANLPSDISEYALEYVFNKYGKVQKVHLMTGKIVKGAISALVEYDCVEDTEVAIDALNDKYKIREGFGHISVKHASSKRSKPY
jgi:RNA recognition motif-containing protein